MVEEKEEDSDTNEQRMKLSDQLIDELNPTNLINIDFFKSYGLWDEEVSSKYEKVIKKWENVKQLTQQEQVD